VQIIADDTPRKKRPVKIKFSGFNFRNLPSDPIKNIEPASKCNPIAITSLFGRREVMNGVIKQVTIYNKAGMQKEMPIKSGENPIIFRAMLNIGAMYVTLIDVRI
jgi:hypothetical protein